MYTNKEAAIVATISLLAIVLTLYSSLSSSFFYVFAANYECHDYEGNPLAIQHSAQTCCSKPDSGGVRWCTDCARSSDQEPIGVNPHDCGSRYRDIVPLSTNNTTPSSGLLNGRIPTTTNTFNAPITTTGANTSNPTNNNTTTGSSLNTIRGSGSSATRSLINGNSPAASGPQPQLPYSTTINSSSAAMKATRSLYSPTGGCIPGGNTCVPCDIGLARIGANCIPSGDWHPRNGLPPLSTLQQQQQQPTTTTLCPDGSQPDANGKCPTTGGTTSHPPLSPLTSTKNQGASSNNNNNNNNNNNAGTNPIKHCSKTNAGGPHCPKAG
jgi:hypothetical protein